jgi:hypothetical protein
MNFGRSHWVNQWIFRGHARFLFRKSPLQEACANLNWPDYDKDC